MTCNKAPGLITLEEYDGNYQEYEKAVYSLYEDSFAKLSFSVEGKPVTHKTHPMTRGMSGTFWHIVSSGSDEEAKLPDLRRYERVLWPGFILGNCMIQCDELLIWRNKRKTKTRILLWCRKIDYLVVLDDRQEYCVFWTAYPTSREHTKRKLLKEYEEYMKNGNANS